MKKIKKILALMLALIMCVSVVGVIPAKAAAIDNLGINWFAGQNGNPWSGSPWTFHTGKDGVFTKMTNYIVAENTPSDINAPGWWADANAETAYIGTWRQQATQENWAVTALNSEVEGNISGTSSQILKTQGAGSGDVMVVLKNADGFYPLWPSKGEWQWQTVADTTGIEMNFTTGYKPGDTVYYIVKPSEGVELTRIQICPCVTLNEGTATDYPTTFTAWGGDRNTENDITNDQPSWFFGNSETNPHTASNWATMYGVNGNFFKMTAKEGEKGSYIWHPENVTDTTYARAWGLYSTTENWAVMGYAVSQTGTATSIPYNTTTIHANGGSTDFMIVLRNGSTGRFYPLYPTAGEWEWKTLTGNSASPDVANGTTLFSAPVQKDDIIYYVAKPTGENTTCFANVCPRIDLTDDKGVLKNYPTDDKFTGWENSENDDSLYGPYMSLDVSAEQYQEENIRYGGLGRVVAVPKEGGGNRLWATTNGGGLGEGVENFTLFYYSDDNGVTWSDAVMVCDYDTILGRRSCRFQDHNLFYNDVTGDLWLTIGGSTGWYDGRWFTYVLKIHNPGAANVQTITWDEPKLIMDKHEIITGVPGSSPIRLSDGTIAMVLWNLNYEVAGFAGENKQWTAPHQIPERYQKANLIISTDNGETFKYMGGAAIDDVSGRLFDESSVYQKDMTNPNELVMVSRVRDGLVAFESHDKGVTWTQMNVNSNTFNFWADNGELKGTCSNFVIRRLQSGNLLMIYHDTTDGSQDRSRLMARVSTDDGATWSGGLLLCETGSSYPSAIQASDGTIHVVYDTGQREIHSRMYISSFTETQVLEGDSTTEHARKPYCIMMGEPVYKKTRTMTHSSMYTQYASGMTAADAHSRGYEDMAEFWYEYGTNFNWTNVEGNGADSIQWNSADGKNTIGSWFMTATGTKDSAIVWRSLNHSNVTYSSSFGEIYLSGNSGTADVMIVQKRGDNYYPLWPTQGEFEWKTITGNEKAALSDNGTLTTAVKPYDEIIVILRAGSAQITVNPTVSYTTVEADSTIVINHLADSLFVAAPEGPEEVVEVTDNIGWAVQQDYQPAGSISWTFEYFSVINEEFKRLEAHVTETEPYYWQSTGGVAIIKGWQQRADNKEYAAVAVNATNKGLLNLTTTDGKITGGEYDGQFMLLQKSGNKYHALTEWIDVAAGASVTLPEVKTYVKAGDVVYYLYKSNSHDWNMFGSTPKATYTKGVEDTDNLYPTEWNELAYVLFEGYRQLDVEKLAALKEVLVGKNISIMGDSISTYEGYSNDATNTNSTIGDNAIYYTSERLKSVNDTWWMQTAKDTGMNVLVNNSWSGSKIFAEEDSAGYKDRAVNLHDNTGANAGTMPDVIAIYLGTNDYNWKWEAGTYSADFITKLVTDKGDGTYTYAEPTNVAEAYFIMIHKITTTYPNADVFCMNLMPITWRTDEDATSELVKYNSNIRAIARCFGVNLVDLNAKSGITLENCETYTLDGGHPNGYGMDLMTAALEEALYYQYIEREEDKFVGMTLSLDGTIGFNFYVNSDNALSEDAYVFFTLPSGTTQTVSIIDAVETNDGLKFTCNIPAKEMSDVIVATLYDGDEVVDTESVSIRDYAEVILKNESNNAAYTAAQPLIKAMINYGAYAQKLFGYNVENLANKGYETDTDIQNVSYTDLSAFNKERQGQTGLGSLAGASLVLESETTLRMFFQFETGVDLTDLTFTVDGVEQPYEKNGNYYIVDFKNIAAKDLDKDFTVTVSAGGKSFNATCSAMTFCYNALTNTSNVALQNVAKAMYLYNISANDYFG